MKRIMQAVILAALMAGAQSAWSEEAIEPVSGEAMPEVWSSTFAASDEIDLDAQESDTYAESEGDGEMQLAESSDEDAVGAAE